MKKLFFALLVICLLGLFFTACSSKSAVKLPLQKLLDQYGNEVEFYRANDDCIVLNSKNVTPNTHHLVEFKAVEGTVMSRTAFEDIEMTMSSNSKGEIGPFVMSRKLPAGEYEYIVDNNLVTSFEVKESTSVTLEITNEQGEEKIYFNNEESVFINIQNLNPNEEVHIFIVEDINCWEIGEPLLDVSEGITNSIAGETGDVNGKLIWWYPNTSTTAGFDVVIDRNKNGIYDSGDIVSSNVYAGVILKGIVQTTDVNLSGVRGTTASVYVEDLSMYLNDNGFFSNGKSNYFNLGDNLYCDSPMLSLPLFSNVDIYVVEELTSELNDISGGYETFNTGLLGDIGQHLIWPSINREGSFYIVIDINQNGILDDDDFIDGDLGNEESFGYGFQVTPENSEKNIGVYIYTSPDTDDRQSFINKSNKYFEVLLDEVKKNPEMLNYSTFFIAHDLANNGNVTYNVLKRNNEGEVEWDVVETYSDKNFGDIKNFMSFIDYIEKNYPAEKKVLCMHDHGGGWFPLYDIIPEEDLEERSIMYEDGKELFINQIRSNLRKKNIKFDLLISEACFMQQIEVAYEWKDIADYLMSSETTGKTSTGFVYSMDKLVSEIVDKYQNDNKITNSELKTIFSNYFKDVNVNHYQAASFLDTSKINILFEKINEFVSLVLQVESTYSDQGVCSLIPVYMKEYIEFAAQIYDAAPYKEEIDLYSFFNEVENSEYSELAEFKNLAGQIRRLLEKDQNNFIIDVKKRGSNSNLILERLHGIGIWGARSGPNFSNFIRDYSNLSFTIKGDWEDFLEYCYLNSNTMPGGALRVQLTWGKDPQDIDSHLWTSSDPSEHVCFYNLNVNGAYLDLDDVDSYGPENIRIQEVVKENGKSTYYYKVHLFSGVIPSTSGTENNLNRALVQLFSGSSNVAFKEYYQPEDWHYVKEWWNIFEIDYSDNNSPVLSDNTAYSKGESTDAYSNAPLLPENYNTTSRIEMGKEQ